jgi:hypothetical protein
MIVTKDSRSSYETLPTLRLFSQPMDLLPPPPVEISHEDGMQLAPEYVDPTARAHETLAVTGGLLCETS